VIAVLGVAAAAVQVIGLSRWVLLVPGISRGALDPARAADAHRSFELVHTWLGTVLGGTIGYALTAASLTNFAGYVAWCLWLIALAVILWRVPRAVADRPVRTGLPVT
jgi:hypothetical protein